MSNVFLDAAKTATSNCSSAEFIRTVQQRHIDKLKEELRGSYDIRYMGEEKFGVVNLRV
jgi:hypothetical protein